QKADANFMPKAACASCHNNSFAALAVGSARRNGFAVNEKIAVQQGQGNVFGLMQLRDNLRQGFIAPVGEFFGPVVIGDILLGLDAEQYKADLNTDTAAIYLRQPPEQVPLLHWRRYPARLSRQSGCDPPKAPILRSNRGSRSKSPHRHFWRTTAWSIQGHQNV